MGHAPTQKHKTRKLSARRTDLGETERRALDENGYLVLEGVVDPRQVSAMRSRLEELLAVTPQDHAGTLVVGGLLEDPLFDAAWNDPRVLAAVEQVLGEKPRLMSVASRGLRPGHGQQGLHRDWGNDDTGGVWYGCHAICPLVDFTEDNGATRVVPGSHQKPWMMKGHKDPRRPHPAERNLLGGVGTVFILNIHCFHSAVQNESSEPRLALFTHFSRRDSPLLLANPVDSPSEATIARHAPAIQALLRA